MLKKTLFLLLLLFCTQVYAKPNDVSSLAAIQALIEQGNTVAATNKLLQLVKAEPEHYQAWFLLGVNQAEQRQFDAAIASFRRVIVLQPTLAEPHNNLAVIYNETGDFRAAVTALEASLLLKPDYVTAQENIGDLYVKLAADAYRKVLARDNNPVLQHRYQRLLKVHDDVPLEAKAKTSVQQVDEKKPAVIKRPKAAVKAVPDLAKIKKTSPVNRLVKESVLQALERWRLAWENKDMTAYFSAYSADFQYDDKYVSLEKWQDYKTWAMRQRSFIRVKVENIETEMLAQDVIKLNFLQHFRSDSHNSSNNKELLFRKTSDGWKIIYEVSM